MKLTISPNQNANTDSESQVLRIVKELSAVIACVVNTQGMLIEANRGFIKLMDQAPEPGEKIDIRGLFIQPNFTDLITQVSEFIKINKSIISS